LNVDSVGIHTISDFLTLNLSLMAGDTEICVSISALINEDNSKSGATEKNVLKRGSNSNNTKKINPVINVFNCVIARLFILTSICRHIVQRTLSTLLSCRALLGFVI